MYLPVFVLRGRKSLAFPVKAIMSQWCIWPRLEAKLSDIFSQHFKVVFHHSLSSSLSICELSRISLTSFKQTFTEWPCSVLWEKPLLIYSTVDPTNNTQFHFLLSDTHLASWFCLTKHLLLISSSWRRITHLIIAFSRMWPLHLGSDLCLDKKISRLVWSKRSFCTEMGYKGEIKRISDS